MSQTLSDIYKAKCISLAATMVIHHPSSARIINDELQRLGYPIDLNKPATWKYYLNLSGRYHQYDLDVISQINGNSNGNMQINVAGDKGPVPASFTKELISGLDADLAVANEYQYGSRYYKELVLKYPDHQSLILGILNPIDISTAIYSQPGDILYAGGFHKTRLPGLSSAYGFIKNTSTVFDGGNLIEPWEHSLLPNLERWIKNFLKHYDNPAYGVNHSLYAVVNLGQLYLNIAPQLMKFRLMMVHTHETHSYHVGQYLDSNGNLGRYINFLNREQYMYLYRNVDYLQANLGKEKVFKDLIDNILTPSGIPIAGYNYKHNLDDILETTDNVPFFERQHINFRQLGAGSDKKTVLEMLEISANVAKGNSVDMDIQEKRIERLGLTSSSNNLTTKVLESNLINWNDDYYYSKTEFMFNHWLYAVSKGVYKGTIYATNPQTGDRLQLTAKNAFALMLYCYNRGYHSLILQEYPNLKARLIAKPKKDYPSFDQLRAIATSKFISDDMIKTQRYGLLPDHTYSSTNNFQNKVTLMHRLLNDRWLNTQKPEDLQANLQMEFILSRFYYTLEDLPKLFTGTYADWLDTLGIEFNNFSKEDYMTLADELLLEGQGIGSATTDYLSNMHRSLIEIMKYFSSYNVYYIHKTSIKNVHNLGHRSYRLAGFSEQVAANTNMDVLRSPIYEARGKRSEHQELLFKDNVVVSGLARQNTRVDFTIPTISLSHSNTNYVSNLNVISTLVFETHPTPVPVYSQMRFFESQSIDNKVVATNIIALEMGTMTLDIEATPSVFRSIFIEASPSTDLTDIDPNDFDLNID